MSWGIRQRTGRFFGAKQGKNRRTAPRHREAANSVTAICSVTGHERSTVLVTAFEPFGGETVNASWEAARALDGWRCGDTVAVARRLPCVYDACVAEFIQAFERLKPEAVLMTGQAARRAIVSVERIARNVSSGSAPDNRGVAAAMKLGVRRSSKRPCRRLILRERSGRRACRRGFPPMPATTSAIISSMEDCAFAEQGARDAGGLVHLPATPGQSPRRANARRLATADAVRALQAAIAAMAGAALSEPERAGQSSTRRRLDGFEFLSRPPRLSGRTIGAYRDLAPGRSGRGGPHRVDRLDGGGVQCP